MKYKNVTKRTEKYYVLVSSNLPRVRIIENIYLTPIQNLKSKIN